MRVAESGKMMRKARELCPSMGPQHESCGKPHEKVDALLPLPPFNGAAT